MNTDLDFQISELLPEGDKYKGSIEIYDKKYWFFII